MQPINVHEFGNPSGPTLLLVHGLAEAGTAWPDAVARWGARYRILAVDQRGHGLSPRFADEHMAITREFWRQDLEDVLRGLDEPPTVVAFSMGATISLRVVAEHPELARALILEDPARPQGDPVAQQAFVDLQLRVLADYRDGGQARRDRLRQRTRWTHDEIEAWSDSKLQVDVEMIRNGIGLGANDLDERLNDLQVPALVIVPEGGPMAPDPQIITNPLVRIRHVPNAGHSVRRDAAADYHALADPFLAELHAG